MHRYALIVVGCLECCGGGHTYPELVGTYQTEEEAQSAYDTLPKYSDGDKFILDMHTGKNLSYSYEQ